MNGLGTACSATSASWARRSGWLLFVGLVAWGPLASARDARPTARPAPGPTTTTHRASQSAPSAPVRLVIPVLDVRARVVPVAVDARRTLLPPREPEAVGWWSGSALAGAARGGTVIAGHTVRTGGGALGALPRLRSGDRIDLGTARGTVRYRVDRLVTYHKSHLARDAEVIFNQAGPARLVLVTCEEWDGRTYRSNVVAFASPV